MNDRKSSETDLKGVSEYQGHVSIASVIRKIVNTRIWGRIIAQTALEEYASLHFLK